MTSRRWTSRSVLALALIAGGGVVISNAATHTIVVDGMRFTPASLTVKRGDTIVWRNDDLVPHTATARGVFDSATVGAGKTWRYKATAAGEHAYICTLHPTMKGVLVVR